MFARCVVPVALLAGCGITPDSEPRALPPDLTGPARDRNPENDLGNVPSSIFMQAGESRRLVPVQEVAALSVEDIAKATLVSADAGRGHRRHQHRHPAQHHPAFGFGTRRRRHRDQPVQGVRPGGRLIAHDGGRPPCWASVPNFEPDRQFSFHRRGGRTDLDRRGHQEPRHAVTSKTWRRPPSSSPRCGSRPTWLRWPSRTTRCGRGAPPTPPVDPPTGSSAEEHLGDLFVHLEDRTPGSDRRRHRGAPP